MNLKPLAFCCLLALCVALTVVVGAAADDFEVLLERLRRDNPGEYEKVRRLADRDRAAAWRFLRERYGSGAAAPPAPGTKPAGNSPVEKIATPTTQPARHEKSAPIETLRVGEFTIELCRRDDGAFGLGEVRRGALAIRRADSLVTWQVAGRVPRFAGREGLTVRLREPEATLTFAPERRESAGTVFAGFSVRMQAAAGPIVETASWEPGGTTRGLTYFDGYRGWHAPPSWQAADRIAETNPKLTPSLLHGTGFQFEHGRDGALVHFHTSTGDRLRNVSRGEALEFETTFDGPTDVTRFILTATGDSTINLWTRAHEIVSAEQRRAFGVPERSRELWLRWPPFSRKGFAETARECAEATARDGFTGACIDVVWDNSAFHGGGKNMNVWDYTVCEGYGGEAGLRALVDECRRHKLLINAWVPAGHLGNASPVWAQHPDWVLKDARGEAYKNPSGIWHGDLAGAFAGYFSDYVGGVVHRFRFDGVWMDSHLGYAQQWHAPQHAARLAGLYRQLNNAGAGQFFVEGDAGALGGYSVLADDKWFAAVRSLDPDLCLGSALLVTAGEPRIYLEYCRQFAAAGAPWVIDWDFLNSTKLKGDAIEAARREVRQVLQDYRRMRDRMVHRFTHADGSGYTWTNDRDPTRVVWLLRDATLPDGRRGEGGKVYLIETPR